MKKQNPIVLLKFAAIGGLFAILLVPLIVANGRFSPNLVFPFITGKNFAFRILVEFITAAWIILAVFEPAYRPKRSWIAVAAVLFVFIISIADIFGENPFKSIFSNYERMEGLITLVHLLLYLFVAGTLLQSQEIWRVFFLSSICISIIICLNGFIQLSTGIAEQDVRISLSFGNPLYLAVYILFHLFITSMLMVRSLSTVTRHSKFWVSTAIFYVPTLVLQFLMLCRTGGRGAVLGFFIGVFVTGILLALTENKNRRLRIASYSLIGTVALTVVVFIGIRNTDFVRNNLMLNRLASISANDPTANSRLIVWDIAYQGFKERPLLGWGQENFNYVFNKSYNPVIYDQEQWFDRSHNTILDWLIAGGSLGLISYIMIWIAAIYLLWRRTTLPDREKSIITGLLAGYFFQNLFVFDNITSYILFLAVLAYIHFAATIKKNGITPTAHLKHRMQYVIISIVIIAMASCMYLFVKIPVIAASLLIDAIQFDQREMKQGHERDNLKAFEDVINVHSCGTYEAREKLFQTAARVSKSKLPKDIITAYVDYARAQVKEQIQETPNDARYFALGGNFLQQVGLYHESIDLLTRAHELSPKKQSITMALGSCYLGLGKNGEALATLKDAYETYPKNEEAKSAYALVAVYSNRLDIVNDLYGTAIVMDKRFLRAYRDTRHYDLMIAYLQNDNTEKDSLKSKVALGIGYWVAGKSPQALALFKSVLASTTDANARKEIQQFIDGVNQGKAPSFQQGPAL